VVISFDFTLISKKKYCCDDFIGTYKAMIFVGIWCWAPVVLGHELDQAKDLSLCPFSGDQI